MRLLIDTPAGIVQYTEVELADGKYIIGTSLEGSGGIELIESGSVTVAVYNTYAGETTLGDYFDHIEDFQYLRAELSDSSRTMQGTIYDGDIKYDEVDRKWTLTFLADAEAEVRDRLRRVALRDAVTNVTKTEEQVVMTTGAPVVKDETPLYQGTVRHRNGTAGYRGTEVDTGTTADFSGWQSVGAVRAWLPSDLMEQTIQAATDMRVSPVDLSAHDTTPTTGSVPEIPLEPLTYTNTDGSTTQIPRKGRPRIWQVDRWDEPLGEESPPVVTGVPDWTGEEMLDYYLQRTGRRLIAEYDDKTALSPVINIYFADDTPNVVASSSIDSPVPTDGIAPDEAREQTFYKSETKRPRLPDLAVQIGQVTEESITPSDPGHRGLLDVKQQGIHMQSRETLPSIDTSWYSPYNAIDGSTLLTGELYVDAYRECYRQRDDFQQDVYDIWSPWVAPPYARFASERWSAGRDTKIVEGPESTIDLPTRIPQFLFPIYHRFGVRRGESSNLRNYVYDRLKDVAWRPGSVAANTLSFQFPEQQVTEDKHKYEIGGFDEQSQIYNGGEPIGQTTDWLVQYQYAWPLVPYESDDVFETVTAEGSRTNRAFNQPASLLWIDARKPGRNRFGDAGDSIKNNQLPYVAKGYADRDLIDADTPSPFFPIDREFLNEASSLVGIDGMSLPGDEGIDGIINPTWAYHTWSLHKASTLGRVQVQVEVDTTGLSYQVGDSNKGLDWHGKTWLVAEEERRVDRNVATLTLERYITRERKLYSQEREPTVGAPRKVRDTISTAHIMRVDDSSAGDEAGPKIRDGQEDAYRSLVWQPPKYEDQMAILYYEVQRLLGEETEGVWLPWYITTGTAVYMRWSGNLETYSSGFRVRSVGWPQEVELTLTSLDPLEPYDPVSGEFTQVYAEPVVSDWKYAELERT